MIPKGGHRFSNKITTFAVFIFPAAFAAATATIYPRFPRLSRCSGARRSAVRVLRPLSPAGVIGEYRDVLK
ncbi:MAG: hypothetical protein JO000_01785 [Alphaproteobacteria bacterium]|nr:hypothetical protein [Alphaproteobacteria bacterium]